MLDSDSDGFSNGFELGDECCLWSSHVNCSGVLNSADLSFPGDPASVPLTRKPCACNVSGPLPLCACCGLAPCSPGGGGGGGNDDDDDDDDDVPTWALFAAGGGGAVVLAAVAGWCAVTRQRKAAAAKEAAAGGAAELYAPLNG